MQPITFPKAGKLLLNRYVNGVPVKSASTSFFRAGAVQSIVPSIELKTSTLPDGNSDWDAAELDTGKGGTIIINLSFMSPELYAFLLGTDVEDLTSTVMPVVDWEITVPETSPYTVTLPYTPIDGSILMVDQDGKPVTEAETTPSAGSYTILDDELTFNAADKGKTLFVCFDYTALAVKSFGLPKSGSRPAMQAVISGEGMGEDESTFYDVAIIIDKCKATGNINPPEMSREPKPQNITLKVLKPRGNNKAVDFKFAARA